MDPFHTLGIEPHYDLDLAQVEKRYRDLSRALHPDRYSSRPAGERRMALSRAIEVNEAWRCLRDPVRRAEAMLILAGASVGDNREPPAPPALLMEMMEQREALADARASKNHALILTLLQTMQQREQLVIHALADALDAPTPPHDLQPVVSKLGELRYIRRFLEEASFAEDELS